MKPNRNKEGQNYRRANCKPNHKPALFLCSAPNKASMYHTGCRAKIKAAMHQGEIFLTTKLSLHITLQRKMRNKHVNQSLICPAVDLLCVSRGASRT